MVRIGIVGLGFMDRNGVESTDLPENRSKSAGETGRRWSFFVSVIRYQYQEWHK